MNARLAAEPPAGPHPGPDIQASSALVRQPPPRIAVRAAMALRGVLLQAADRMLPAHPALLDHAHQFAKAHLLCSLAELQIADHLASGPQDAGQLAALTGCDPGALHRALRAAACFGVVRLDRRGRFHTTRLLSQLQRGDPGGAADWCQFIGSASHQAAWAGLSHSIRTGRSAFRTVHGTSAFDWFAAHPQDGQHFNAGIAGLTQAEAPLIAAAYPFPDGAVICDIAGGTGALLAEILRRHRRSRGILIETPAVLASAGPYLRTADLAGRVELTPGDISRSICATADIYLLKWVLHDWDDTTCQAILRRTGEAMPAGATLIVIEGVQPHTTPHPRFSMIDLQMLVMTDGGYERSLPELEHLITTAGLRPGRTRHTATGLALLEATKPPT
ncbi:MAG TPA: methyltransferase [Streptosporangiaceae bacterium]